MNSMISRRALVAAAASLPAFGRAGAASQPLRIGCLTDLNGPYADLVGQGTIASIKLAIEDFAKLHPDIPVELLVADFGLKPDTGLAIMRDWFDQRGVHAIIDVPLSALALAAVSVLESKNKVGLFTS
ncbi:MAG: ABC transporter substrate-binding protein, partial [Pseudomonadota bacterium]|nr:ABC transporter substrate-binding protein [Pseudomonadota bacterium]